MPHCFFFYYKISFVYVFKTYSTDSYIRDYIKKRERATTLAVTVFGRAITLEREILKRSHEKCTKSKQKSIEIKLITIAITKLEERKLYGEQ